MDSSNFDTFNRISLYVLVKSFEQFPNHIDIDPSSVGYDAMKMNDENSFDEAWDLLQISKNTIEWLLIENFLESQDIGDGKIKVRLTLQGLTLVGYGAPTAKNSGFSNFKDQAIDTLKSGSSGAASDLVKGLLVAAYTAVPNLVS